MKRIIIGIMVLFVGCASVSDNFLNRAVHPVIVVGRYQSSGFMRVKLKDSRGVYATVIDETLQKYVIGDTIK